MDNQKLCVNCVHYHAKTKECRRQKWGISLVTGEPIYREARHEREWQTEPPKLCGMEGVFWTAKPEKPF